MHALCGIVTEQYVGLHSAAELMAATGDRVPCVWMENQQVLNYDPSAPIEVSYTKPFPGEPTGKNNPELLKRTALTLLLSLTPVPLLVP